MAVFSNLYAIAICYVIDKELKRNWNVNNFVIIPKGEQAERIAIYDSLFQGFNTALALIVCVSYPRFHIIF